MSYDKSRHGLRALSFIGASLLLGAMACRAREAATSIEPAPSTIVDAAWLKARSADSNLVIVHVGHRMMAEDAAITKELIPGSVELDYMDMVRDTGSPPVNNELLARDSLARLIGALGIANNSRIVVYSSDPIMAARAFMTLEAAGLRDVHFLNGGTPAWKAAGGTTTMIASVLKARPALAIAPNDSVLVTADWVREHLDDPNVALVDTRTKEEYEGVGERHGIRTIGHLPGAQLLVWETLMVPPDSTTLRSRDELSTLLANAGAVPGKTVVTYCHLGYRASLSYLAARAAGLNVRIYDGSYNEWALRGLPLVKGANPK